MDWNKKITGRTGRILNWVGWIAIAIIIGLFLYRNPPSMSTLPSPGEEFSAISGTCWGSEVSDYGRPDYASDPGMVHMSGHPCYTSEQCEKWPPVKVDGLYCCVPTGTCVVNR